jgi:hypothetical protein
VRSQNSSGEVSIADRVADETATEDLELVLGEVGDLLVVTAPLGVAEGNGCGDLVLDAVCDVLNGTVDDGSTLAIKDMSVILLFVK